MKEYEFKISKNINTSMNYDFRQHYAVGQHVSIIDEDDVVMQGKVVKVTAYCVHCQVNNERIAINRNASGDLQVTKTGKEISIEIVD